MRLALSIALTIILLASHAGAVREIEKPFQLPAPPPDFQAINGVTMESGITWHPIVAGEAEIAWIAHLSDKSRFLSISYGAPLPFINDPSNEDKLIYLAVDFVVQNAKMLGCEGCTPRITEISHRRNLTIVTLDLAIDGVKVEVANIVLVLNQNGALISVKADAFGGETIGIFDLEPVQLRNFALSSLPVSCSVETEEFTWLPERDGNGSIRLLASNKLELTSENPTIRPTLYVDASSGNVLAAENRIHFVDFEGASSGGIFPSYGREEQEIRPFVDQEITIEGSTVFTDDEGIFSIELDDGDSPFSTDAHLNGHWVVVSEFIDENPNAHFTADIDADQFAEVFWNNNISSPDERNLYYHVNIIHDHYKQLEPDFVGMDFPIDAICGVGGAGFEGLEDNAFSNGPQIYFGRGRQADNFAHYCDVIYHEYGHSVTGAVYGNNPLPYEGESGAMNEGWSDYFTCSLTDESRIGEGGLFGNGVIRNIDNNLIYPRDLRGEVHDDSRMFSAALWHTREILGARYCDSLFHFARYLYADDFREYFLDVLITDDDDGDLTNGSPNYRILYEQFARHGITLLDTSHFQITHVNLVDSIDGGGEGDDNGLFEPGEKIQIDVSVFRTGAPIPFNDDSIFVQLSSDSPFLDMVLDRAKIAPLRPGEFASTTSPLMALVDSEAPLTFANIYLTVGASEGEALEIDTVRIPLGRPPIALVSDGKHDIDRSFWFHRALDQLGLVYADVETSDTSRQLSRSLAVFDKIIWFTGDAEVGVLEDQSREALEGYLDGGGKLIITGQHIDKWNGGEQFLSNRLGAHLLPDTINTPYLEWQRTIEGEPLKIHLRGGIGANNQRKPSVIRPINNGQPTFLWMRVPGNPAGAVRRFDRTNHSQTIFYAFGMESVGGAGRTTTLAELLDISLEMLDEEVSVEKATPIVTSFALHPAFPNPFNSTTTISFSLPSNVEVSVEVFDLSGRLVETLLSGKTASGEHRIAWRTGSQPSGVYYVQLRSLEEVERRCLLLLR